MARFETTSSRPYHLVIFGASGFTGQFVVEEVGRTVGEGPRGGALRWAVAGRSRLKLEQVLEQAAAALGMYDSMTEGSLGGGRRNFPPPKDHFRITYLRCHDNALGTEHPKDNLRTQLQLVQNFKST